MDAKTIFNDRRAVGSFDTSKKVAQSVIKDIVDMAVLAPSAFNLQPWRIIVVQSDEKKQSLYELANKQDKVLEASANLILVGNKEGYSTRNPVWNEFYETVGKNEEVLKATQGAAAYLYGSSDEGKLKFAESNVGLFGMALIIAAKEHGVDTHPMSGLDFGGIHKAFDLAPEEVVVMNIAIGYAKTDAAKHPRRARRGFEDIATTV